MGVVRIHSCKKENRYSKKNKRLSIKCGTHKKNKNSSPNRLYIQFTFENCVKLVSVITFINYCTESWNKKRKNGNGTTHTNTHGTANNKKKKKLSENKICSEFTYSNWYAAESSLNINDIYTHSTIMVYTKCIMQGVGGE